MQTEKSAVYDFWNHRACGEELYLKNDTQQSFMAQAHKRYELEPMIKSFAEFEKYRNKDVLEIGVGLGADHQYYAQSGALLHGVDLTERAILHTENRLKLFHLESELKVSDAENLSFADHSFDLVYSWGVLHHTPDTPKAISEAYRVLKPGGEAKIMIYHKYSLVGYMLWIRYALFGLKPGLSLADIYARYLESPGTKAYSIREARALFQNFFDVEIQIELTHGDLLTSQAGQRHTTLFLKAARILWPRRLIKKFFQSQGLFMLIKATK
jgi:ubiquinone/menaquinone biosynthesis C-methylase UbiE